MRPARAGEMRAPIRSGCWALPLAALSCVLSVAPLEAQAPGVAPRAQASQRAKEAESGPAAAALPKPSSPAPASPRPARAITEARACFQEAQVAYIAGDLARALEGFLCAYRAAPSPELHFNLARVYERMGEADSGIQHYEAYLAGAQVLPKERKSIERRIASLRALRERQLAQLEPAKPSAEALGAEARVFYDRGVKLYRAREYPGALAAFSAALQMSSAPELHFNLAVVSERLNRPRDAVDHYRAYLAARPNAADSEQVASRISLLQSQTQTP